MNPFLRQSAKRKMQRGKGGGGEGKFCNALVRACGKAGDLVKESETVEGSEPNSEHRVKGRETQLLVNYVNPPETHRDPW